MVAERKIIGRKYLVEKERVGLRSARRERRLGVEVERIAEMENEIEENLARVDMADSGSQRECPQQIVCSVGPEEGGSSKGEREEGQY
jgi:hypothetical protein